MIVPHLSTSVAGVADHPGRAAGEGRRTMSKLVRVLVLGAILVVMSLAATTAVAEERTTTADAVELFRAGERATAWTWPGCS
jgi:uncharacterized membrane protein YadS